MVRLTGRLLAIVATAFLAIADGRPAEAACAEETVLGKAFLVCTFDAAQDRIVMALDNAAGDPWGRLPPFVDAMKAAGTPVRFAMNGGMYDRALQPIGLYVEDGQTLVAANTRAGPGNFHMLPNGVFFVAGDWAGVMETRKFVDSGTAPSYATQSGPLIVENGRFHPRLLKDSTSRKFRNGVGVRADGQTVVFAVSLDQVTFWEFATLFRDGMDCRDALYLDGTISSIFAPEAGRYDRLFPVGPIIAVLE